MAPPTRIIIRRAPKGGLSHESRRYSGGQFLPNNLWEHEKAVASSAFPGLLARFTDRMQFLRNVYQMASDVHKADFATSSTLSPDEVSRQLREAIHDAYEQAFLLGKRSAGNLTSLTPSDAETIRRAETDEYSYLDKFLQDMSDGAGILDYKTRMDMYGKAVRELYWSGWALANPDPQRRIWWLMNPVKEHCHTCVEMAQNSPYRADAFAVLARQGFVPQSGRLDCRGYYCGCFLTDNEREAMQALADSDVPAKHKYASAQINLPDHLADLVRSWADVNIDEEDLAEDGIEQTPHVTVKYGIDTEDLEPLEASYAKEAPFEVRLGKFNVFEAPEFDVLFLIALGVGLVAMNKLTKQTVPTVDTFPLYQPHVTVAYLKKGTAAKYLNQTPDYLAGAQFMADQVVISDQKGVLHRVDLLGEPING